MLKFLLRWIPAITYAGTLIIAGLCMVGGLTVWAGVALIGSGISMIFGIANEYRAGRFKG